MWFLSSDHFLTSFWCGQHTASLCMLLPATTNQSQNTCTCSQPVFPFSLEASPVEDAQVVQNGCQSWMVTLHFVLSHVNKWLCMSMWSSGKNRTFWGGLRHLCEHPSFGSVYVNVFYLCVCVCVSVCVRVCVCVKTLVKDEFPAVLGKTWKG